MELVKVTSLFEFGALYHQIRRTEKKFEKIYIQCITNESFMKDFEFPPRKI